MIKKIVTDVNLLSRKSKECFFMDLDILKNRAIIEDMIDTAYDNIKNGCLGLAANQIGENVRIILIKKENLPPNKNKFEYLIMVNPKIFCFTGGIQKKKENCLSFPGRESSLVRIYWENNY